MSMIHCPNGNSKPANWPPTLSFNSITLLSSCSWYLSVGSLISWKCFGGRFTADSPAASNSWTLLKRVAVDLIVFVHGVLPLRQYRTVDDLQLVTRVWHVLVLTRLRDDRLVYKDCRSSLFLDNVYINVCLRLVANLTMTTLVERKLIWFFHFFFFIYFSLFCPLLHSLLDYVCCGRWSWLVDKSVVRGGWWHTHEHEHAPSTDPSS